MGNWYLQIHSKAQHQQSPCWVKALGAWDSCNRYYYAAALKSCAKKMMFWSDKFSVTGLWITPWLWHQMCSATTTHITILRWLVYSNILNEHTFNIDITSWGLTKLSKIISLLFTISSSPSLPISSNSWCYDCKPSWANRYVLSAT